MRFARARPRRKRAHREPDQGRDLPAHCGAPLLLLVACIGDRALGVARVPRRMTPLDAARQWLGRGLSVIPVPAPDARNNGKVPAIAWREYQTRLPAEAELPSLFGATTSI